MVAVEDRRKVHHGDRRPRRRGAAIRLSRSLKRNARRRSRLARGLSRRRDWVRRALVAELLGVHRDATTSRRALNLHQLAEAWRTDPRVLRRHMAKWARMGWLRRIEASGGRRKPLIIDLNVKAFWSAAQAMRLAAAQNPDLSPLSPIKTGSASSAGGRREVGAAPPIGQKSPKPDRSAIRLAWKHLEQAEVGPPEQASEKSRRAAMRVLRLVCWRKGLSFAASSKLCSAVGVVANAIGSRKKRKYLIAAALFWLSHSSLAEVEAAALAFKPIVIFARHGFPPDRRGEARPPAPVSNVTRTTRTMDAPQVGSRGVPAQAARDPVQLPLDLQAWQDRMMAKAKANQR